MGRRIIGIDPGLSGAVAVIWTDGISVKFESVHDTPVLPVKRGKKTKREYLVKRMVQMLTELEELGMEHFHWFASGDCMKKDEEQIKKIMFRLNQMQFIQCGFTRNRDLWEWSRERDKG